MVTRASTAALAAACAAVLGFAPTTIATSAAADPAHPNIIVIVTDDQVMGTMDAMPYTSSLKGAGLAFTEGILPTSLCCPSRSSLLTGNYAHTTGVWTNHANNYGGWETFHRNGDDQSTLATHLATAGYRTGLFGKYLNDWADADGIPPGWDTFEAFNNDTDNDDDGFYYNYQLAGTQLETYGGTPADYSTDVLGQQATDFITSTPADQPFLLYFATTAPHAPTIPPPRYTDAWPLEPASAIPALNEADVSDKPTWVRTLPTVSEHAQRERLTEQHETLMAVDDAIHQIVNAAPTNTLVVFMSDNGLMLGTHRIRGKDVPYDRSTRVPMFVYWPGHITPGTTDRVTPQIDLTALVADAAGVTWSMDGSDPLTTDRQGVVLEQTTNDGHPAYCGWHTPNWLYVRYASGEEELYNYSNDPDALNNVADKAARATRLADLRDKAQRGCNPQPPGFSWAKGNP